VALAGAGEDGLQPLQRLVRQLDLQRAQAPNQTLERARADDRHRDDWVVQQLGQGHVRRLLAQLTAQPLVGFQPGAVRLGLPPCVLGGTPSPAHPLQDTA
jgi:hypothetical protein